MSHRAQSPVSPYIAANDANSRHENIDSPARINDRQLFGAIQSKEPYNGKHRNGNGTSVASYASLTNAAAAAHWKSYPSLLGQSPSMLRLDSLIERISPTDNSVLITGATGTGKELVARSIHRQSFRRNAPFIDINCSAIPEALVEAELFGHQRGSFTSAHETKRGLFEEASGGTLFFDEVNALSLPAQAKLLRVVQEKYVRRVGGRENIPVNVRIISATSRDLRHAVAEGSFRLDLLFRLRVIPLQVPELRERGREDIKLLIDHFLHKHAENNYGVRRELSSEANEVLALYHWPGNVRELENAIAYALAIGVDEEVGIADLPPDVIEAVNVPHGIFKENLHPHLSLAENERRYILSVLDSFQGSRAKTAIALDLDPRTLNRKLKTYMSVPKSMSARA